FLVDGSLALRSDFDDVLVVGLISQLLVVTGRVDGDPRARPDAGGVERVDRRAEVSSVVTARKGLRQVGVEIHDDLVSNLAQVDMGMRVGQPHHHATGAVRAAAEVDAADCALTGYSSGGAVGQNGSGRIGGDGGLVGGTQHHDDVVAFDAGVV